MNRFLFFLFFFAFSIEIFSQDCDEKIYKAQKLFDEGRFLEIDTMLTPCINTANTKNIKVNAARLLALTNMLTENINKAKEYTSVLLSLAPNYNPDLYNDPAAFKNLISSFTIVPKFSLSVGISGIVTFPAIEKKYSVNDYNKTYSAGYNLALSVGAEYRFRKKLSVGIAVEQASYIFDMEQSIAEYSLSYRENINTFQFPLKAKYFFGDKKFQPFVALGMAYSYIYFSSANISRTNTTTNEIYTEKNIDITDLRKTNLFSGLLETGFRHRFLSVSLSAGYFLSNVNNSTSRYSNFHIINNFFNVDDNFNLFNCRLNIYYILDFKQKAIQKK